MRASPHTRGWTRGDPDHGRGRGGFPAHAGMDPSRCRRSAASARLPRTRGDGPCARTSASSRSQASPHTRGWTPATRIAAFRPLGFPAHAGMDPPTAAARRGPRRLPRTRGDGPAMSTTTALRGSASPHTRGWTLERPRDALRIRGFPAHAGMDPAARPTCAPWRRLPRTRGDGPRSDVPRRVVGVASPHTRGWTVGRAAGDAVLEGFPAHAGMDLVARAYGSAGLWLPRTRGDGPSVLTHLIDLELASPHTRGWTLQPGRGAGHVVGFPAHAGMDPAERARRRSAARLPRTRGDGPAGRACPSLQSQASPHTRGWTPSSAR